MRTPVDMLRQWDGFYDTPENPGEAMMQYLEEQGYVLVQRPEIEQHRPEPGSYSMTLRMRGFIGRQIVTAQQVVSEQLLFADREAVLNGVYAHLHNAYGQLIVEQLAKQPKSLEPLIKPFKPFEPSPYRSVEPLEPLRDMRSLAGEINAECEKAGIEGRVNA